jgi:hypothetical protein
MGVSPRPARARDEHDEHDDQEAHRRHPDGHRWPQPRVLLPLVERRAFFVDTRRGFAPSPRYVCIECGLEARSPKMLAAQPHGRRASPRERAVRFLKVAATQSPKSDNLSVCPARPETTHYSPYRQHQRYGPDH